MLKLNKIRQLLALLIVLSGLSLALVLYTNTRSADRQPQPVPKLPANVEMSLQKIHLTENRDGVKKWEIIADKAEYGSDKTHLTGVQVLLPGNKDTGDVSLTAARGVYHTTTKNVALEGGVVAQSTTGMKFSADNATFDAGRNRIHSLGNVTFSNSAITVKGGEMELFTDTRDLRVTRNVTATVKPESARK